MRIPPATVIGITAALLAAGGPARATVVLGTSDEALARESEAVVLGTVTATEVIPGRKVETRVTVSVERALKGVTSGAEIQIREPGGRVGNLVTHAEGVPEFQVGERVVLFLTRGAKAWRVHGLSLGKFSVVRAPGGGGSQVVQVRAPGLTVLQEPGTAPPASTPESLEAFLDRIERALAEPPRSR